MPRFLLLILVLGLAGCSPERKAYMRHPLVKAKEVMASPNAEPETATQVDPYPPVRPVLPNEMSPFLAIPVVQGEARTPALK